MRANINRFKKTNDAVSRFPRKYVNSLSLETFLLQYDDGDVTKCKCRKRLRKLKGYGTPFTNALVTSHWEIKAQFPPKAYARMLMFSIPQVSKHLFPSLRSR